ncbi:hypothetical protein EVAR_24242_1 [Eumeta japonica]|uniref:Uncharacterized protein n=1 Tax=Eumeta variegata TaxID=151549 RepID=A0A4C1W3Z4_EUMVA|nr:hypothetical protein EVAR_24242_1 [Eumeta japonica]
MSCVSQLGADDRATLMMSCVSQLGTDDGAVLMWSCVSQLGADDRLYSTENQAIRMTFRAPHMGADDRVILMMSCVLQDERADRTRAADDTGRGGTAAKRQATATAARGEQRPTEKKKGSSPPRRVKLVWYVLHISRLRAGFEGSRRRRFKKEDLYVAAFELS